LFSGGTGGFRFFRVGRYKNEEGAAMALLAVDESLAATLIKSTIDGLAMASLKPIPAGISKFICCKQPVSSMVGFAGPTSGNLLINASEPVACFLAGKMVDETFTQLDSQTLDGMCEITNIVAGQTKAMLSSTEHRIERLSTPSVIVGANYSISHYRGMTTVAVEFEIPQMPIKLGLAPVFAVNLSLIKL